MSARSLVAIITTIFAVVVIWTHYGFKNHHVAYDSTMGILLERALQTEVGFNQSIGVKPARDMVLVPFGKQLKDGPCGYYDSNNAVHCSATDKFYLGEQLMQETYGRAGSIGPFAIAGHENGHHIGYVRGYLKNSMDFLVKRSQELQADCFSGAYVMYAFLIGMTDDPRTADLRALFQFIGNYEGDYHGTPEERAASFYLGVNGGAAVC